jgi:hypothetical protein
MEDSNQCIKNEIISFIEKYKKDDIIQQNIALKINELLKNMNCFFCLDQKQCWDYRGEKFKGDNKGDFYKKICPHCLNGPIENLWIEDCISTDLVGPFGIKLFRHDAQAGSEKFKALENDVIKKNPELVKPEFNKSSVHHIHTTKKTYELEIEVGKIIDTCKQFIESYMGNPMSMLKIINNIKVSISGVSQESNKNKILCEEINTNEFMYIVIKNYSTEKEKSRFGIYKYNKYYLDIQIDIYKINTLNDSAHHLCSKIINEAAGKNINEIIKLFE